MSRRFRLPVLPLNRPVLIAICLLTFYILLKVPMTGDWRATFFEAGRHWLTPYADSYHFVYPPWLALILAPLGLTTVVVSRALFGVLTIALLAFAVRRLGGGVSAFLMILLTPFWVTVLVRGETDAWPLLGLALGLAVVGGEGRNGPPAGRFTSIGPPSVPPGGGDGYSSPLWGEVRRGVIPLSFTNTALVTTLALILLAIKPHTLGGAALILLLHAPRKRQVLINLALFGLLTLLVYGFWPLAIWERLPELYRAGDIAVWPWGIPVGIVLLWLGYRRRSLLWAAPATFLLVPYFSWYSLAGYAAILLARLPRPLAALLLVLIWLALAWLPGVFG